VGDAEAVPPAPAAPNAEAVVPPAPAVPNAEAVVAPAPAPPDQTIYIRSEANDRLWQGEILANIPQVRLALESIAAEGAAENPEIEIDPHPLVIVLTQDCDLLQDFNARHDGDSILSNILLCDVFLAEELRAKLRENENLGTRDWKVIYQNKNPRFQFLQDVLAHEDLQQQGLPALAVDFQLHFTMRTDELYRRLAQAFSQRRCRLATPYPEHLSDRFYHYMARIALPVDHADTKKEDAHQ
jgi:hypothetical protein